MNQDVNAPEWLWIIVETEQGTETIYGQADEETGLIYIPAFVSEQAAETGRARLPRQGGRGQEIQAIRLTLLARAAAKAGAEVWIVDEEGRVSEKLLPVAEEDKTLN